ncbi:MAG: hypothetical protein ACJAU0_002168 [Flavobacteriales bacterium]|jgi:hypothetical protein
MRTLTFLLIVLFVACKSSAPELPPGVLSRAQFVAVLADIQLIEGISKHKIIRNDDPEFRLKGYYKEVFRSHNVSDTTFRSSYNWYYSQPEEMLLIYDEVLMELNLKEEGLIDPN